MKKETLKTTLIGLVLISVCAFGLLTVMAIKDLTASVNHPKICTQVNQHQSVCTFLDDTPQPQQPERMVLKKPKMI